MSFSELPSNEEYGTFVSAVQRIQQSPIEIASELAHNFAIRVNEGELGIAKYLDSPDNPFITSVDLIPIIPGDQTQYLPFLIFDEERLLSINSHELDADLVRTMAIADQLPLRGYQERYKKVYKKALNIQLEWLKRSNISEIPNDPRAFGKDELLKLLLGEVRYRSDVGFNDWVGAIEKLKKGNIDNETFTMLENLKNQPGHFVAVRKRFLQTIDEQAMLSLGRNYEIFWDEDRRANTAAHALVGLSLGPQFI